MLPSKASERHYQDVQRIVALAVAAGRRSWSRLNLDDLDGSFRELVGPELLIMLSSAQNAVASLADGYASDALTEINFGDTGQEGRLIPGSLAGVASDGRGLPGLLRSPVTEVKDLVARGATDPIGLAQPTLERILWTQVADANRAAESVAIASRVKVDGYVRMLNPPSCSRCAILAGRFYRYNAGFQRHPKCDCGHIPSSEDAAGDVRTVPEDYFKSLSSAEQDRIFTKAGAQAIRDGADMGRVVNARRGMATAQSGRLKRDTLGAYTTREGLSRRGRFPGQRDVAYRLMPESIYEVAVDRADAVRLLRRNGYLR